MRLTEESPCWVWSRGEWCEGFVLEWQREGEDWAAYCEWSHYDAHGFPKNSRGLVRAPEVVERVSTDPRGRGGERPAPPVEPS